ncbi:MAG: heavy metal transporter [Reichenbachiella sp.]|uniref:heavy metal transporter n=1 Tax=Reichenbachiella sp. TaxID=2184521 RepID=UPI002966034F|nr:heavy metal transporter [Reichenbachiella sp.]MDW3210567.1 heavy metal transporter [Reichenbachiella sp.]
MGKIIRQKLPTEYSIGILLLIFVLSFFLSGRLFETHAEGHVPNLYIGMFLVSVVVIVMVFILWEELFFPIKINPTNEEVIFRNHRNKLKIQVLIYLTIPVILGFLYVNYKVNLFSFIPYALVCLIAPVVGKLGTGINNYNDFLRLSESEIEYKNNELEGVLQVTDITGLALIKDEDGIISKLDVTTQDHAQLTIDLDEMELEEFYDVIEEYLGLHYTDLLK